MIMGSIIEDGGGVVVRAVAENGPSGETAANDDTRGVYSICLNVNSSLLYHIEDYCDGRMSLPLMVAMLVLGFVTFFVNLGVIIRTLKVLRHGHDNKPAFYFIGNLALSDLAIGLYVVIAFLLHITKKSDLWQRNSCLLQIGVAVTACQETIFSIVLIAVDKYLYICHGLRYSFIVTTRRVYAALGISWFLSVLIGSLPALGMQVSWEEACNRCVFAQVISKNFAIVFFVTSVVGPYAVVVSLYSVLLMLALKMHRSRYGGSLTVDPSARSSNVRLSFISKRSKSSKSTVSTTVSAASTTASRSDRRRQRRREVAEQKASRLPGVAADREATAKLIRYTSQQPEGGDPLIHGAGGVVTPPLAYHSQGDDAAPPATTTTTGPGDLSDEVGPDGVLSAGGEGEEANPDSGKSVSSATHTGHPEDVPPLNGMMENTDVHAEQGVEHHNSLREGSSRDAQSAPGNCAVTTDDDLTADDTADEADDPPAPPGRSWFPTKYLNRVMADTRDKMLFLKKCRALKTVLLIIVSFSATYVPFVVGALVYSLEAEKQVCLLHMLSTLLYCAVVANSLANPLIYAYGYREFRMKTKKFKGVFAREKPRKVV